MASSSRPRKTISDSLRQLNMYALAAGAAGVGVLSLARSAEAKIIYTPAHVKVAPRDSRPIDIDHDGMADFYLRRTAEFSATYLIASAHPSVGNGVAVNRNGFAWARAIRSGAKIGAERKFVGGSFVPRMGQASGTTSHAHWSGPWADGGRGLKNRYLGIKFLGGDGHFHYGWARVTVSIKNSHDVFFSSVLVTGYAYETIPNKAIIAGATKGPDDVGPTGSNTQAPEVATLGMLALGTPGLSIWRREESLPTAA